MGVNLRVQHMKIDFRRKNLSIRILILLFGLGFLAITLLYFNKTREPDQTSKNFRSASKLAYAKGIHFTEYRGDKKVYSVSIDSFSVERARVGPFAIGPLRVGQFSKVNVDLYLDAIESKHEKENGITDKDLEVELLDFGGPISNIRNNLPAELRRVRAVKLKDLSLSLWRGGERIFRISSDTAEIDQKTRDLIFVGHALMDSGQNGRLLSHRIRWGRKTHRFSAGGPYLLTKNGDKKDGTGIEVDYLFRRIHYQTSSG
jgi:hypothetical protein